MKLESFKHEHAHKLFRGVMWGGLVDSCEIYELICGIFLKCQFRNV